MRIKEGVKIPEGGIPVAIDSNIFLLMADLLDPSNDPTGEVMKGLINRNLNPSRYKKIPRHKLPKLLQHTYFYKYEDRLTHGEYLTRYTRLEDMFKFYQLIKHGIVHPFLIPSVFNEITDTYIKNNTIPQLCSRADVPDHEYPEFVKKRDAIATEYLKKGAIPTETNDIINRYNPTSASKKMAEAALLGLVFVTADATDYIHGFGNEFSRQNEIESINEDHKLLFSDNFNDKPVASRPYLLSNYLPKLTYYLAGKNDSHVTVYLNSDKVDLLD